MSERDELVARMRDIVQACRHDPFSIGLHTALHSLAQRAADAIERDGAELERLRAENERLTEAIDRLQQTWAENAPAVAYKARAEAWERASQEGHPDPCTLGPLCPYCEIARLRAEVERLKIEAVRCEMEMGEVIDTRDEMESALSAVHAALGGDGEWACRVPSPPPPDSGNLSLDVPVLAAQALARAEAAGKDAGRYRWLRNECNEDAVVQMQDWNEDGPTETYYEKRGAGLDAAIDAAMEGGK